MNLLALKRVYRTLVKLTYNYIVPLLSMAHLKNKTHYIQTFILIFITKVYFKNKSSLLNS